MQIVKKRLKNSLSNKIFQNQLTPFTILYIVIDQTQTITTSFPKKIITKTLFNNTFKVLKKVSFIHPLNYISTTSHHELIKIFNKLKNHQDFNKIIICNIKIKSLIFKNFTLLDSMHVNSPLEILAKLYFLLNPVIFTSVFLKKK